MTIPFSRVFVSFRKFVFFALISGFGTLGQAQTWVPTGSGDWVTPGNWSGNAAPNSGGTARINNGGTAVLSEGDEGVYEELRLGADDSSTGSITMSGGSLSGSRAEIGSATGSTGTVTMSGGNWSNDTSLYVGASGHGTLSLSGGTVNNGNTYISGFSEATGTVTVNGGTFATQIILAIGDTGTGQLNLQSGLITSNQTYLGSSGGTGTATMTAGTWNAHNLYVGYASAGFGTAHGTLNVSGGTLTATSGLYVSYASGTIGELNLSGSGVVTVGNGTGTLDVARGSSTNGTLNMAGGTLNAAEVHGGGGVGVVKFSQTGTYEFATKLTGNLSLTQSGTGTTSLNSFENHITGTTTVTAGTLLIDGELTSGAITVNGGILGGGGEIVGEVNVNSGGTIMAGSGDDFSTLTATGNQIWSESSLENVITFTPGGHLSTNLLNIVGNLTVTGTITIRIDAVSVANFQGGNAYQWVILRTTDGIFDSGATYAVELEGFGGLTSADHFSVVKNGTNLRVTYSAAPGVPEPSVMGLLLGGGLGLAFILRKKLPRFSLRK